MISADRTQDESGWRELHALVHHAITTDTAVAHAWEAARHSPGGEALPDLADALAARAHQDPHLLVGLRDWCRRVTTADGGASDDPGEPVHHNTVSGEARLDGPTLQARDVHGGVHFHSSTPSTPAPTPVLDRPPAPRQLPPPGHALLGRDADAGALSELRAGLPPDGPQVLVVTGPAGVGKSALAAWWLRSFNDPFPDGELYADLRGHAQNDATPPSTVLERFLRAVGSPTVPAELSEQVALWRTLTSDLRLALLLDDAFTAAQVRPLLPSGPGSVTVVTSRRQLTGLLADGAVLHPLRVLTADDAVDLLARGGPARVAADPRTARRVAAQCAHLPLAVCLAAAQLAARPHRSLTDLAESLAASGPLEALREDGEAAVRAALDQSYELLPQDAARTYRHIGLLPTRTVGRHLTAAVCGTGLQDADHTLDTLVRTSLLEESARDRYSFHDLVRAHAAQRGAAEGSPAPRTVDRRFVDWCLATATRAEELLTPSHRTLARDYESRPLLPPPFDDEAAALAWLDEHRDMLTAAVRRSAGHGWHKACWQLVDAMWPIWLRLRPAEMWVEAHELGLDAARRAGDRDGEGRMLTSGGNGLRNAGRHREAAEWYHEALRQATEDGDERQQAQAANGLGNAYLATGDLPAARARFHEALRLRERVGYVRGAALTRLCLGETALADGNHRDAADHLARAHRELTEARDPYDAARALALLGHAHVGEGDRTTGVAELRRALEQFVDSGSHHWQARTWELLGEAALTAGDREEARRSYGRAHAVLARVDPLRAREVAARMGEL
ncbi:tetratricopeptide repeat protein [Streptomyces sp. NPDC054784]